MAEPNELSGLDYFSGGVPTGAFFKLTLGELQGMASTRRAKRQGKNFLQELCFIGLMSYFEAFCKDHFAALMNIEPALVSNLKHAGQNVEIDGTRVVLYGQQVRSRMGFLLAERYDFGTAQKINSLYGALLNVTPFSKPEVATYSALLKDRNLLVHHGGTLTLSYLEQAKSPPKTLLSDAFFNSCVKGKPEVLEAISFLGDIALKLIKASHAALLKHIASNGCEYIAGQKQALDYLLWWD